MKTVFGEAYLQEDIDRNPGYRVGDLLYKKKEPSILTPEEIRELFKNRPGPSASEQAYDLFYPAAFTGMRSSEVRVLPWWNVDAENKAILVHQAWHRWISYSVTVPANPRVPRDGGRTSTTP